MSFIPSLRQGSFARFRTLAGGIALGVAITFALSLLAGAERHSFKTDLCELRGLR